MLKLSRLKKFADILANVSLLLNSFAPFLFSLSPVTVHAETPLESAIEYNQSTHEFHINVNTDQKLNYQLVYKTNKQIESVSSNDVSDSPEFSRDIYAGTCSGNSCTPDNVKQGVLKIEVPSQNWIYSQYFNLVGSSLQIFKSETSAQFDLTDDENYFVENGQLPEVTVTPTNETTPTETLTEPTSTPVVTATLTPTPEVTVTPSVLGDTAESGTITTSILPYGMSRNDLLNPTLFTDKDDYAPTEIAIITGTGFTPNTQYFLHITANNLDQTYIIFSDENGEFTYSYQLDGTYRPDYQVEAKDITGSVVTFTKFTDSVPFSSQTVNSVCMADQPNSTIGSCSANDISIASVSDITIIGHGCRFPGDTVTFSANWKVQSSANERYNVGLWFATGGQSDPLHGQCSVSTLPSGDSPFFEEKPDSADACGDIDSSGPGLVNITMTAVCNPDSNGFLKLPYCTSWLQNKNEDGNCSSPLDTLPGTGSKCNCQVGSTIPITIPPSIEVIKSLFPTNDSGLFNLQINGTTAGTGSNVGNNGTTGKIGVTVGSNTIGEIAGDSTVLNNYTSNVSCVLRGTTTIIGTTGVNPWTLNVSNGQDIVCTITNTRKAFCGDGHVDAGETCDDGNNIPGDGCSATC